MTFLVQVDSNYHYQDAEERYTHGRFETFEEAEAAAKRIVDSYLASAFKPGMTANELYASYTGFGDDPFIVSTGEIPKFSAWDYASERSGELCAEANANGESRNADPITK